MILATFQPLRSPAAAAAVPPSTLSASGDSGAVAPPNLIDFDLSPQPPLATAQATENPFAPVNTNDISVQLASMSKWALASMFLHFYIGGSRDGWQRCTPLENTGL